MGSILPFIAGVTFLSIGFLALVLSLRALGGTEMTHRLHDFVSGETLQAPARVQSMTVRRNELAGNFRTRVMQPWFRGLGGLLGRLTPSRTLGELEHRLVIAGNPLGLGPREFYGLRLLFNLAGIGLAFLALRQGFSTPNLLLAILAIYIGVFLPTMWLKRAVRRRQNRVRKDLPDALDMLSVCAQAGLGFDQSLQRVSENWKTALSAEFGRVVGEMEMGVSRQAALRNLADRLSIPELSSFAAVIIQSDQLGMSIADTLQAQAEQMRIERRFRAQEQARKVPLKMLFPMIILIFPAMMAVVCGPTIPILVNFFRTLGGG